VGIAEAVEVVRGVDLPAAWWGRLYAALDGADREELAALPVPLADGRTAHGPAGVLLPDAGLPVDRLGPLGLRSLGGTRDEQREEGHRARGLTGRVADPRRSARARNCSTVTPP
jgi:hypothetical protein